MDTYVFLRESIYQARDAYDATLARRRRLYHWLRANESWHAPGVQSKLGALNYEWLVGLVEYGRQNDWDRFGGEKDGS